VIITERDRVTDIADAASMTSSRGERRRHESKGFAASIDGLLPTFTAEPVASRHAEWNSKISIVPGWDAERAGKPSPDCAAI
jgi:hypothetical protein